MKTTERGVTGVQTDNRQAFDSTMPSGGIRNVSEQDNGKVLMNKPEMDQRGSRADALIEIMNLDTERLGIEPARHTKIVG